MFTKNANTRRQGKKVYAKHASARRQGKKITQNTQVRENLTKSYQAQKRTAGQRLATAETNGIENPHLYK